MASLENGSSGTFQASRLAKWFHSAPHKDLDLEGTTTIFSPADPSYRQALFVLTIFIASFGVLLFLLILMFYTFCYCLCRKPTEVQDESCCCRKSCLRAQILILAVICSGALIVGFVYNGKISDGVDQFRTAVDDIQSDINDAYTTGYYKVKEPLKDVLTSVDITKPLQSQIKNLIEILLNELRHVNNLLPEDVMNETKDVGDKVHRYDNYRWLATVILLSWCILSCIFLFWLGCQVKCCVLFMVTLFCLLTVLFTWAVAAADFGIATGIGDFCVHPKEAIQKIKKGNATSLVISYYMDCNGAKYNPFEKGLNGLQDHLGQAMTLAEKISGTCPNKERIIDDLSSVKSNLPLYEASFTCENIHGEYMDAMDGLCEKALNSLAIVMVAVFVIAVFSGLIICCTCPLWKHRRPHPTRYNDIRNSTDDIGNAVVWWPHDMDAESDHSFHRRHPEPNERSPLIQNQRHPDVENGRVANMNFVHVNVNYGGGAPGPDEPQANTRHSF